MTNDEDSLRVKSAAVRASDSCRSLTGSGRRWRATQPGQVEGIVLFGRDQMDHAVGGLADREVSARLGRRGTQREAARVAAAVKFARRAVVGDQAFDLPGLALVVGERGEQPRADSCHTGGIAKTHLRAKGTAQNRPLAQSQEDQALPAAKW